MSADLTPFGLAVGHATDGAGATGLTVVRGIEGPFRAAVTILGRASGTRETPTAQPQHLVDRTDAILLTGGSAYGLDAAAGVMRWMEEHGRGYAVGGCVVPIVPAAVVFDLFPLGRPDARPTPEMAYEACRQARPTPVAEGSVGAGTGATVGKAAGPANAMKGGVGCATLDAGSLGVAALAVVNALGDVRDEAGHILAGARTPDGRFADSARLLAGGAGAGTSYAELASHNTTLAVVATTAPMSRTALLQLSSAAAAALYHRITPTGTSFDGDVIFAVAPMEGASYPEIQIETLAVTVLGRAIEHAVRRARGRDGIPGLADDVPSGV